MTAPVGTTVSTRRRWVLAALCVSIAMVLAARGLGNEAFLSTHGDPPRYMMNAMFILDLLRDRPFESFDALREYATLYYARYPALSLGHHPPLVSILQVPFLALLGPSVTALRLPLILAAGLGVLFIYLLVTDLYDEWAGAAAGLAMAASPGLADLGQGVMSEPPAVAASVIAAYCLHRFCMTGRRSLLVWFSLAAVLSALAKPNAVVAFPAFALYACARLGWRRLLKPDLLATFVVVAVLAGSFVGATAAISSINVRRSTAIIRATAGGAPGRVSESERRWLIWRAAGRVSADLPTVLDRQVTLGVAAVGLLGLLVMAARRRPDAWLFGVWTLSTFAFVVLLTQRQEIPRYGVYWVPALAAAFGALVSLGRTSRIVVALAGVLLLVEVGANARSHIQGLEGYEQAARYITAQPRGSTVMFSGDVDTGYFIFFVRKHDAQRRQIVLRSDKIFTVSDMRRIDALDLIEAQDQVGPTLRRLGVGYVVIEDQPSRARVLEWLRAELQHGPYVERLRVPIGTTDRRLQGVDLVVYEVPGAVRAEPDARLDLRLPIVSRQLDVPLDDLIARKHLR